MLTRIAVIVPVFAAMTSLAIAQDALFLGLGTREGQRSFALDVAHDGSTVAGWMFTPQGEVAVIWSRERGLQRLGELEGGAVHSEALGASAAGEVIVGVSDSFIGPQAIRWTPKLGLHPLSSELLVIFCSAAYDVSADGKYVVGEAFDCFDSPEEGVAFRWTEDGFFEFLSDHPANEVMPERALGISSDGSVVVGEASGNLGTEAFRWTEQDGARGLGFLCQVDPMSVATAVSGDGNVVVGYSWCGFGPEAFRWTPTDGMVGLGDLPDGMWASQANAVCHNGSVVVGSGTTIDGEAAFIWIEDQGLRFLQDYLESEHGLDLSGWKLREATGICGQGRTIVGWGTNPQGDCEMWMARLPDTPSTHGFDNVWPSPTEGPHNDCR